METLKRWKEQEAQNTTEYIKRVAEKIARMKNENREYKLTDDYKMISQDTHQLLKWYKPDKEDYMERFNEEVAKEITAHYERLQAKVESKIGKIEKIETIGNNGHDYTFTGTNGKCQIKVVNAGGWNIQRKHTRWTMAEIK